MESSDALATQAAPAAWPLRPWHERLILFFLPFLLYAGSLGFGLINFDDDTYYYLNGALQDGQPGGLVELWKQPFCGVYAPITQLTLWIDLALFGTAHWWGARLHGLLWFGIGSLAVQALISRLTGRREWGFWVALGYALHPVCSPSLLWLAERKNLVCFALSLWSIERYLATPPTPPSQGGENAGESALDQEKQHARHWPWVSWVLAALALLAKAQAVAIPAMLLVYEITFWKGPWPKRVRRLTPFFMMAGVFTWFTLAEVSGHLSGPRLGGSALGSIVSDGPILWRYLSNTVAPLNLPFVYAVEDLPASALWGWGACLLVGVFCAGTVALVRKQWLMACAWLMGFAALSPALNLVAQPVPMADHYLQWAMPFWLLGIVLLVERLTDGNNGRNEKNGNDGEKRSAQYRRILLGGLALGLAVLSWMRVPAFRSDLDLFGDSVIREPRAGWAWARYALALAQVPAEPVRPFTAGSASLRALECADARRIVPETLAFVIQEAALHEFRGAGSQPAWELVEREARRFEEIFGALGNAHIRAYVAAHTDRPEEALKILGAHFPPEYEPAAAKLREFCRDGTKLPEEVRIAQELDGKIVGRPLLELALPGKDAFERESGKKVAMEILYILARAHLTAGNPERAFDVAAVLSNMEPAYPPGRAVLAEIYERLNLPAAAAKVRRGDHER